MISNLRTFCATALLLCVGAVIGSPAQVWGDLTNGSFEAPYTGPLPTARFIPENFVAGWETTASDGLIEIWSNSFDGVTSDDGNQHAEINADEIGTLYQDATGISSGMKIDFEFSHRAMIGTDTLSLTITDLGADNMLGGGNDSILFTNVFAANDSSWTLHNSAGIPNVVSVGNHVRFAFEAVSSGGGDLARGNFIDAVSFNTSPASIPEPSSLAILLGLVGIQGIRRRQRVA